MVYLILIYSVFLESYLILRTALLSHIVVRDTLLPRKKAHVHLCDVMHPVQIKAHACKSDSFF